MTPKNEPQSNKNFLLYETRVDAQDHQLYVVAQHLAQDATHFMGSKEVPIFDPKKGTPKKASF